MEQEKKNILVIEDEKPLAHALELKLIHEGFNVKILVNGENLLSVLHDGNFSLIICDLIMPKVDGFEVLQILKENKIKIPIIILTNLSQSEDEKKVHELGAANFFIKSNTPISEIIDHVKAIA
jgi:DNA-binding response OmpR family regulator